MGDTYFGWGPNHQKKEIPKHMEFGNAISLTYKWFYKNTLSLKGKSLNSIEGLKNTPLSDKFVEILMNICDGKNVPKNVIDTFSDDEKALLNQVLHLSGMNNIDENQELKLSQN